MTKKTIVPTLAQDFANDLGKINRMLLMWGLKTAFQTDRALNNKIAYMIEENKRTISDLKAMT
jgi:hypothetical protein